MPPKRKKKPDPKGKKGPAHNQPQHFRERATRDVRLTTHPAIAALQRLAALTRGQYGEQLQRSGSIFGQEQQSLQGLPSQYGGASKAMMGNLQDALSSFGGPQGGGFGAENAAASGVMNAGAQGALGVLGAGQQTDLANLIAAQAGAAMQRREMGSDILSNRQQALDQIGMQRQDILGQMPTEIRARMDDLRQQFFENSLAHQQFQLNKQQVQSQISSNKGIQDYLLNTIGGILGGGGGGGGGGGFGGGGNGPGGVGPGAPGGRDTAGHGGGPNGGPQGGPPLSPFQQFTQGQRGWGRMTDPQHHNALANALTYWSHHGTDPAFRGMRPGQLPPGQNSQQVHPWDVIQALRDFYYGPRRPGGPGGRPLP